MCLYKKERKRNKMETGSRDYRWQVGYDHLREYVEEANTAYVKYRYVCSDNFPLGHWVRMQRDRYDEGKLEQERIDKLNELGMIWNCNRSLTISNAWMKAYDMAKRYFDENGNLAIPTQYVTADGYKLGRWLFKQRQLACSGNRGFIDSGKCALLNEIDKHWYSREANSVNCKAWSDGFMHAKAYAEEYGNLHVPFRYVCEDGYRLGTWIAQQRSALAGTNKIKMTKSRKELLDSIGMIWTCRHNRTSMKLRA